MKGRRGRGGIKTRRRTEGDYYETKDVQLQNAVL